MSNTESRSECMSVDCAPDDSTPDDGVFVSGDYLNVLLTLAYADKGSHCQGCTCPEVPSE